MSLRGIYDGGGVRKQNGHYQSSLIETEEEKLSFAVETTYPLYTYGIAVDDVFFTPFPEEYSDITMSRRYVQQRSNQSFSMSGDSMATRFGLYIDSYQELRFINGVNASHGGSLFSFDKVIHEDDNYSYTGYFENTTAYSETYNGGTYSTKSYIVDGDTYELYAYYSSSIKFSLYYTCKVYDYGVEFIALDQEAASKVRIRTVDPRYMYINLKEEKEDGAGFIFGAG